MSSYGGEDGGIDAEGASQRGAGTTVRDKTTVCRSGSERRQARQVGNIFSLLFTLSFMPNKHDPTWRVETLCQGHLTNVLLKWFARPKTDTVVWNYENAATPGIARSRQVPLDK